jgi:hypothetical protein
LNLNLNLNLWNCRQASVQVQESTAAPAVFQGAYYFYPASTYFASVPPTTGVAAAGVAIGEAPGKIGAVSASWSGLLIRNVPSAPVALALK